MIRLNLSTGPTWVDLIAGVRLQVLPVTTAVMAAARTDDGLRGVADSATPEVLAVAMAKAVARQVVIGWEGVGDADGEPLALTPEAIDALIDVWPVFEAFQAKCLGPHLVLEQEKNVSALSPTGTSAGASPTAKAARATARTARRK